MCSEQIKRIIDLNITDGPQSSLERKYILEFLENKGLNFEILDKLPEDEMEQLMREACQYASLKLAEVESRAKFRREIKTPS